jgi:transposase InsO family protein
MGIRDKPIAPASPWQNGFAERLIGSIRRECLDHIVILAKHIYAEFCDPMLAITTTSERTGHWTRTLRPARAVPIFAGCVYRKLNPGRNGDAGRRELRLI